MITRVRFPQPVEVQPCYPRAEYTTVRYAESGVVVDSIAIENGMVIINLDSRHSRMVVPMPGTIIDVIPDEPAASPPASRTIPAVERKTRR